MSDLEEFEDPSHAAEDRAARAEGKVRELEGQVKRLRRERDELSDALSLVEDLKAASPKRPAWLRRQSRGRNVATAHLLLTDTHFDEVVDPEQVDGLNAYDRAIAELRLERAVTGAVKLARDHLTGVDYDGMVLMLGGDIFSGNIHDELRRTNAATLFDSLLYWLGPMGTAVGTLADEFGKLHVVGVPGNHGRMTQKPIAKDRAADNLDWLLYSLLARDFKDDDRVTFKVSRSADAHETVQGTRYLLTHGDQFRGGSGIAGALSPMMLGSHRKTRRENAAGRPYDVMVMGHFHQRIYLPARGLLAGGCLKGYDEFAYVSNFEPDAPTQEFWVTAPEHGITFTAPIFVSDRKREGW